tara:strand:- start:936 stop:1133 length:198 start_codon:yes stop_codon:yes gene_type:complete
MSFIMTDIQTVTEMAKCMRSLHRRSALFEKSRYAILEEISLIAEEYEIMADRIESTMVNELGADV